MRNRGWGELHVSTGNQFPPFPACLCSFTTTISIGSVLSRHRRSFHGSRRKPPPPQIHHRRRWIRLSPEGRSCFPPSLPRNRSRRYRCRRLLLHRRASRPPCFRRLFRQDQNPRPGLLRYWSRSSDLRQQDPRHLCGYLSYRRRSDQRPIHQQRQRPRRLREINHAGIRDRNPQNVYRNPVQGTLPRSDGKDLDPEVQKFLDNSIAEMEKIGAYPQSNTGSASEIETCALCCLAKNREFVPMEIMPGGMMKIVRESPTSAVVKFKAGSVEPAHHHTFGHDLVVTKGSKRVWNLNKNEKYDLGIGDYLFTPAGDVHRVKYFEDTEFFIKWDGHWDIFLDEDIETANAAIDKELN